MSISASTFYSVCTTTSISPRPRYFLWYPVLPKSITTFTDVNTIFVKIQYRLMLEIFPILCWDYVSARIFCYANKHNLSFVSSKGEIIRIYDIIAQSNYNFNKISYLFILQKYDTKHCLKAQY